LAAQGFARASGHTPNARDIRKTASATELFQIDSVNVLVRAHYMPLFSRLGPYEPTLLDEASYGKKKTLFEYWVHEASLVPLDLHPLLRWRMERAARGIGIYKSLARFSVERKKFVTSVLTRVRNEGPLTGGDFGGKRIPRASGWWGWSDAKMALEYLFWAGALSIAKRVKFERFYDLTERVIPEKTLAAPTPPVHEAHKELIRRAARALGVGTRRDLIDYFRTAIKDTDPVIKELVESGELQTARVEGSKHTWYVLKGAKPKAFNANALLSPFDPIVWERDRTSDLFNFNYRIEIYTPPSKRVYGYYVLPFLLGDRLVARVDLKADRQNGRLLVQSTHLEKGAPSHTRDALTAELKLLATWLRLV
jgi:uncharacterized protein YcaQ